MMQGKADRMVRGARLWSDGARVENADAVAIRGAEILAVGPARDLAPLIGPGTELLDAAGATLTPGFTDSHIHLVQWARSLDELSLEGCVSAAEAGGRLRRFLGTRGGAGAVIGRGWDSNAWSEPPDRAVLDVICAARPVLLHSRDFHALWVNGAALAGAGVHRGTPDPPGGRFERDAAGEPTGVVREQAVRAFSAFEVHEADADRAALGRAVALLHRAGITAVHDFEGADAQRLLRAMSDGAAPRVRVLMHLPHSGLDAALALGLESGLGDDGFRLGAVKLFADGTLGSRTASMLEPYDGTDRRGMDLIAPEVLRVEVGRALRAGLAVAIHAIGDRAARAALDAFEAAAEALRRPRLPSRIEHLQLVHHDDLPRLRRLGVAASVQPTHCVSDIELVERWWRTRRDGAYPYGSLVASGAWVAFGSDAPVEPPNPGLALHAAVTRQRADGTPAGGFVPAQRVTLDAALTSCTSSPARLAGQWPRLGRIAAGCHADLVLWNADLHALAPEALARVHAAVTISAGEVVFRGPAPDAAAPPIPRSEPTAHPVGPGGRA
jgi:predicted amidohydrolase YtcJ